MTASTVDHYAHSYASKRLRELNAVCESIRRGIPDAQSRAEVFLMHQIDSLKHKLGKYEQLLINKEEERRVAALLTSLPRQPLRRARPCAAPTHTVACTLSHR